jgi:hypothetical protein
MRVVAEAVEAEHPSVVRKAHPLRAVQAVRVARSAGSPPQLLPVFPLVNRAAVSSTLPAAVAVGQGWALPVAQVDWAAARPVWLPQALPPQRRQRTLVVAVAVTKVLQAQEVAAAQVSSFFATSHRHVQHKQRPTRHMPSWNSRVLATALGLRPRA